MNQTLCKEICFSCDFVRQNNAGWVILIEDYRGRYIFIYVWLWWPFCLMVLNRLGNSDRGPYEEHLCEIICPPPFRRKARGHSIQLFVLLSFHPPSSIYISIYIEEANNSVHNTSKK